MLVRAVLLASCLQAANSDLASNVVELTTAKFDQTGQGLWLLEFCESCSHPPPFRGRRVLTPPPMRRDGADAPWCGHCKKLAPTYEKVANYFHEKNAGVHVAKIDATEHQGLASRFDIKGYPTLLLFREDRKVADFSGPRCARALAHPPSPRPLDCSTVPTLRPRPPARLPTQDIREHRAVGRAARGQ